MKKRERHRLLQDLIQTYAIEKQEDFVVLLAEQGIEVTQATISRDIKELHLIKVPATGGNYRYSMPPELQYDTTKKLERLLEDAFVSLDRLEYFLVMKTVPGNAQAVGALIDNATFDGVLGSICGDDTMLIICRSIEKAEEIEQQIRAITNQ